MDLSGDDLAGIVDQFGALSRPKLRRAIRETAFRAGAEPDLESIEADIDDAIEAFALLEIDLDGEPHLVPGPRSFPTLPDAAADLPHVLDVDPSSVPDSALEAGIRRRLADAVADLEDPDRARELLDVTYDAEAWIDADLEDVRERLDAVATEAETEP